MLAQPLTVADVRRWCAGRANRTLARDWLADRFPPELRVAIEPAVPGRYSLEPGGAAPGGSRCPPRDGWAVRGWSYTGSDGQQVCVQYKPGQFARPDGGVRASSYHLVLSPDVIDDYRLYGYCVVMTLDVVREQALETGAAGPRLLPAPGA